MTKINHPSFEGFAIGQLVVAPEPSGRRTPAAIMSFERYGRVQVRYIGSKLVPQQVLATSLSVYPEATCNFEVHEGGEDGDPHYCGLSPAHAGDHGRWQH